MRAIIVGLFVIGFALIGFVVASFAATPAPDTFTVICAPGAHGEYVAQTGDGSIVFHCGTPTKAAL